MPNINYKKLCKIADAMSKEKVKDSNSDFKPNGYRTVTNLGGYEIEISPSGDAARFSFFGDEPTDWLEIDYDNEGEAFIDTEQGREYLNDYMRY